MLQPDPRYMIHPRTPLLQQQLPSQLTASKDASSLKVNSPPGVHHIATNALTTTEAVATKITDRKCVFNHGQAVPITVKMGLILARTPLLRRRARLRPRH